MLLGVVLAGLVGVALATYVMWRMPSGGEAEAAIRIGLKEQSLKG